MTQNKPDNVLKKAFNEGYEAFKIVVRTKNGFMHNLDNPYPPKGFPHKEWQRGMDAAYTDNLAKILTAG